MISRVFIPLLLFLPSFLSVVDATPGEEFQADLKSTGKDLDEMHLALELARTRVRGMERGPQLGTWATDWDRTRSSREVIHESYCQLAQRLRSVLIEDTGERLGLHRQLLMEWVRRGEPALVRAQLGRAPKPLKNLRDGERRDLLHAVLLREAATPGHDDLDALIEVLEWEALLLKDAGGVPLEQLSTDLILLFTDRAADGFTRGADDYANGLFLDRGLRADLKDASNQLRHLCWALRLFSTSNDLNATQKLLRFKEQRDALKRKLPLNEADLELNRCARKLVERMGPTDSPLRMSDVPALFRAILGEQP